MIGRFGLVIYWAGIGFAVLFCVLSVLAFFYARYDDRVIFAGVLAFFALLSFLVGRAALFILGGE